MKKISKYILTFISSGIIVLAVFVKYNIYNASADQLLYSLFKTEGTSFNALSYGLFYEIIGIIILLPILLLPIIKFKRELVINFRIGKIKLRKRLFPIYNIKRYNIVMFIFSIFIILNVSNMFSYIYLNLCNTNLYDKYYVDTKSANITFPENKQNLIYIFLESTESTNVDEENGGVMDESIMPNLERLALDNINFSNTNKIGGAFSSYSTTWTAAAMVGETSGVPLKFSLRDVYDKNSTSLSNIDTIGDVLEKNGYSNYLLLGSDAKFGGRSYYFDSHNYNISDYYTAIEDGIIDSDYFEWWGIEDSKVFDYAKIKLEEISKRDEPFNFTMLTSNTHFTDGYMEDKCPVVFDNDYANSFYCSDILIKEFIDWLYTQDFIDNTTIVICGDHLTMQDNFYKDIDNYDRTIYNVIINSRVNTLNTKNRVFTTMDMFPTTIASLGGVIEGDRLGLGTNLFSNKKTIAEEIGIDKLNIELRKNSNYYNTKIR